MTGETPLKEQMAPYEDYVEGEPPDNYKWDWYQIGGRWTGYWKLREGATGSLGETGVYDTPPRPGYVDIARKRDIDIESMMRDEETEARRTYKRLTEEPQLDFFGAAKNLTEEEYVHRYSIPSTWAILHKGTWYEKGKMFMFGQSDASEDDHLEWAEGWLRFVLALRPDTLMTLVDCHA